MASNLVSGHVTHNKFLLEPNEAGFRDLGHLLVSSNIKSRNFIKSPEEHNGQKNFAERWLFFLSIIVQKLLLFLSQPLEFTGDAIEMILNLLSNNGGFSELLRNLFTGNKVVWPDRSSSTYASAIGHLDKRVDLDKRIRPGHPKYDAYLSLMAAKLSYENKAFVESVVKMHWNMEFLGFNNFWNDYLQRPATQAFMFQDTKVDPNLVVVAFRGTSPFNSHDWCTDVDLSWYELKGIGRVHRGFMHALGQQKDGWPVEIDQGNSDKLYAYYVIRQKLTHILSKNEKAKFLVTGHSLGGALAILFASVLVMHEETWLLERLEGVYTFGQPRVGDKDFGEFMSDKFQKYNVAYSRYVYCNDMVPRLPYDGKLLLFKHFGPCVYFNSLYMGEVMEEEPNKNYFSLIWLLPKSVNAVWELIRGFMIPYVKGRDYKEGWFQKSYRMMGLIVPGIAAHGPQDYDNSTRLASVDLPFQLQDTQQEFYKKITMHKSCIRQ